MRRQIERYWKDMTAVAPAMPYAALERVAETLLECHARGNTVFVIGNGGSAATASHFACDLAKGTRCDGRPPFRVMPLTDNMPLITAWGNDTSFDNVFAEQLDALARGGDVVVAISCSGTSPNIVRAVEVARERQTTVIALTGEGGGLLGAMADIAIRVPLASIEQVEDAHLMICHSLCVTLRHELRRAPAVDVLVPTAFATVDGE
jgi:D-sedoheptulose 7-phosphate isomerase